MATHLLQNYSKDNAVTLYEKNLFFATEAYEAINDVSPPIMKSIFEIKSNPRNLLCPSVMYA